MAESCSQCPTLLARITYLENLVNQLTRQISHLRLLVSLLVAGVRGTITLIDRETDQPSMPRARLLPAVRANLVSLSDEVEGNR